MKGEEGTPEELENTIYGLTQEVRGTPLVVQWLRLFSPGTGGPSSTPGQGIRTHMPQLRPSAPKETF